MSLEVHIDWQGRPILWADSMRLNEARRFLSSRRPNGFNAMMPSPSTQHRFHYSGVCIMVELALGQFRIADMIVGDES